ncbi:four-helix bundle copper-binding protein [Prosthecomicrobium pneumaticum]|uniref:Ferredoxin n=1 Tax=Prosthecomicrobium pneumaticum TaxID=81895 RepID=A0A7W9FKE9_9HYPH|nr:four-helix bundle copper-binding protein [Prosthecomicrobium pneumaticum]MBB5752591.1 hypothetical protein [Prosthecomicrobium pneumaticum]
MYAEHPEGATGRAPEAGDDSLERLIAVCLACAARCGACADACLAGDDRLGRCGRLALDCAAICRATALSGRWRTEASQAMLTALIATCAAACRACAEECGRHADASDPCAHGAAACRVCEEECRAALARWRAPH